MVSGRGGRGWLGWGGRGWSCPNEARGGWAGRPGCPGWPHLLGSARWVPGPGQGDARTLGARTRRAGGRGLLGMRPCGNAGLSPEGGAQTGWEARGSPGVCVMGSLPPASRAFFLAGSALGAPPRESLGGPDGERDDAPVVRQVWGQRQGAGRQAPCLHGGAAPGPRDPGVGAVMSQDSRAQWKACRVSESPGGRAVRLCGVGGVRGREGAGRAGARALGRGAWGLRRDPQGARARWVPKTPGRPGLRLAPLCPVAHGSRGGSYGESRPGASRRTWRVAGAETEAGGSRVQRLVQPRAEGEGQRTLEQVRGGSREHAGPGVCRVLRGLLRPWQEPLAAQVKMPGGDTVG